MPCEVNTPFLLRFMIRLSRGLNLCSIVHHLPCLGQSYINEARERTNEDCHFQVMTMLLILMGWWLCWFQAKLCIQYFNTIKSNTSSNLRVSLLAKACIKPILSIYWRPKKIWCGRSQIQSRKEKTNRRRHWHILQIYRHPWGVEISTVQSNLSQTSLLTNCCQVVSCHQIIFFISHLKIFWVSSIKSKSHINQAPISIIQYTDIAMDVLDSL